MFSSLNKHFDFHSVPNPIPGSFLNLERKLPKNIRTADHNWHVLKGKLFSKTYWTKPLFSPCILLQLKKKIITIVIHGFKVAAKSAEVARSRNPQRPKCSHIRRGKRIERILDLRDQELILSYPNLRVLFQPGWTKAFLSTLLLSDSEISSAINLDRQPLPTISIQVTAASEAYLDLSPTDYHELGIKPRNSLLCHCLKNATA